MIDPKLIEQSKSNLRAALQNLNMGVGLALLAHDDKGCHADLRMLRGEAEKYIEDLIERADHGEKE